MSATEPSDLEARVRALAAEWTADPAPQGTLWRSVVVDDLLALLDEPNPDASVPAVEGLTEAEHQSLVKALHDAETSGGFWGEHPECAEFADVVKPAVERIVAERVATAKAEGAAEVHSAVLALIGPDEVFPDWKSLPHVHRVTEQRDGYQVTTTMVDERAIRAALGDGR